MGVFSLQNTEIKSNHQYHYIWDYNFFLLNPTTFSISLDIFAVYLVVSKWTYEFCSFGYLFYFSYKERSPFTHYPSNFHNSFCYF